MITKEKTPCFCYFTVELESSFMFVNRAFDQVQLCQKVESVGCCRVRSEKTKDTMLCKVIRQT